MKKLFAWIARLFKRRANERQYPLLAPKGGIAFRHKGCNTECVRYIGIYELDANTPLRAKDWVVNGQTPRSGSSRLTLCPDCGQYFAVCKKTLERI